MYIKEGFMPVQGDTFSFIAFIFVMACWFVLVLAFILRVNAPEATVLRHDRKSFAGVLLLGAGYILVWYIQRPVFTPMFPSVPWIGFVLAIFTVALSGWSVCIMIWSFRTLGKQWSIEAKLVEDHKLVTCGPYSIVRHPIYSAMLGMLLVTGLVLSDWQVLVVSIIIGWYGTRLRIQFEERLLRETFGEEFNEYASRVPSLIPGLRRFK